METLERYRTLIMDIMSYYGGNGYSNKELEVELVFDKERDRYSALTVGWDHGEYVCEIDIHVEIRSGKIWLQGNNTNVALDDYLLREGVPPDDIVIAANRPEFCAHTPCAVG